MGNFRRGMVCQVISYGIRGYDRNVLHNLKIILLRKMDIILNDFAANKKMKINQLFSLF
jgi:hypothetical protein